MRLKDMNYLITTTQPIRLHYPTGESNIATIYNFENYKDYKVIGLWCKNNELNIELKQPEDGEYVGEEYIEILSYLLEKYPNQIIDLYCKEECADDLENVLCDMGISSNILDKYRY